MIKEAKVRRAPRATKVTKEAKAPKGNPHSCATWRQGHAQRRQEVNPLALFCSRPFSPPLHLLLLPILLPRPRWSFRPARSLGSSICLLKGSPTGHSGPSETLPASTLLSPTFQHFPPVPQSSHQVSHQSFRLVRYRSSSFLTSLHTLRHSSSPFLTFHHIPSHSHLHSVHDLLTFHYPLHRFVSSWSFRPARYVFSHSYLPHTAPNGISLVIPAHQIPFSLIDCLLSDLLSNSDG